MCALAELVHTLAMRWRTSSCNADGGDLTLLQQANVALMALIVTLSPRENVEGAAQEADEDVLGQLELISCTCATYIAAPPTPSDW